MNNFLRANQTLRWVDIAQTENMCDGRRNVVFDQHQSNDAQNEKQCAQGHEEPTYLASAVVGRSRVGQRHLLHLIQRY